MFSIILLASFLGIGASAYSINNCPFGVVRDDHLQAFGTHCFRFEVNNLKDYADASHVCTKVGGTLAMPKTKDIDQFLVKQLQETYAVSGPVWIGLDDDKVENDFVWADNVHFNKSTDYSNFARFEGPRKSYIQGDFEDCVAIDPKEDGMWHDYHCESFAFGLFNAKKGFICQYDMINLPKTTQKSCGTFTCDKDCQMSGYKTNSDGCQLCECDM